MKFYGFVGSMLLSIPMLTVLSDGWIRSIGLLWGVGGWILTCHGIDQYRKLSENKNVQKGTEESFCLFPEKDKDTIFGLLESGTPIEEVQDKYCLVHNCKKHGKKKRPGNKMLCSLCIILMVANLQKL